MLKRTRSDPRPITKAASARANMGGAEPSTYALMAFGLTAVLLGVRRKKVPQGA